MSAGNRIHLLLALDRGEADDLLSIARKAAPYVDWIEAGTPWIVADGLSTVRRLRQVFPQKTILADVKIADAGDLEAAAAFAAGADMVTVLGLAGDATVKRAVAAAERHQGMIVVDLMHVAAPAVRAREVMALGASAVVYHVAHDDGGTAPVPLIEVPPEARRTFIVAGGLRLEAVPALARLRPWAIVVGRAITEAPDPAAVAQAFREALDRETSR